MHAQGVVVRLEGVLGPGFRVEGWQAANASLFSALAVEKIAMSLVLLLIVVVAAFGIVSLLVMAVNEKRKEIGILRSMGLPAEQVRRVFVLQGAVIGLIGSALGAAAGLLLSAILHHLPLATGPLGFDRLPVTFELIDITLIVVTSIAVALIATLYPSNLAANLSPVDAIRDG
jgi:lipoprotein-releasing system permease protein